MRGKQTKYETTLWHELRNHRFLGLKFYRQYSVGLFILDFFCPKIRLAIEIDGQQHQMPSSQNYDGMRTQFLNENDIHVVRIKNDEIFYDLQRVLEKIERVITSRTPPSAFGRHLLLP